MPPEAPDPLLRTLAAVAPGTRVVALGQTAPATVAALAHLGLDAWAALPAPDGARDALADVLGAAEAARRVSRARPEALGFPDAFAAWAVLTLDAADPAADALAEAARVLAPGGWVWTEALAEPADLDDAARAAGLALAQEARPDADRATAFGVYRAVSDETVG